MWPGAPTVLEKLFVRAPCILERIGQDRHRAEIARLVHLTRQREGSVGAPCRSKCDRAEWVAEDVAQELNPLCELSVIDRDMKSTATRVIHRRDVVVCSIPACLLGYAVGAV